MSKTRDTGFLNNVIKTDPQGNVTIVSGSTTLLSISSSGAITTTGVISGSNALTSSYSQNSELLDGLDSISFVFTSSYNLDSSSFSTRTTTIESKYATTGSNIFQANQTICANLTTTGTITAQTINVQQVTSSVVYSSGSNVFGNQLINTQQFTGSVFITGSTLNVNGGTICATGNACFGNDVYVYGDLRMAGTDSFIWSPTALNGYTGFYDGYNNSTPLKVCNTNGHLILQVEKCNVGVGVSNPGQKLEVAGVIHSYDRTNGAVDGQLWASKSGGTTSVKINSCGVTYFNGGNVGIGTDNPTKKLQICTTAASENILTITNGTQILHFGVNTSASGSFIFEESNNGLRFGTADTERMRFTNTGIACFACQVCAPRINVSNTSTVLLVEGTATNGEASINLSGKNSSGTVREAVFKYDNTDVIRLGTSANIGMQFETNDVARFRLTNTGIACFSNTVCVGGNTVSAGYYDAMANSGFRIRNSTNTANTGALTRRGLWEGNANYDPGLWAETGYGLYFYTNGDATIKLVMDTAGIACFRCQVCAPRVILGGTTPLTYYCEGSWTPTIIGSTSNPTVSYSNRQGTFTRIGNLVTAFFDLQMSSISGGSGVAYLSGLPFTIGNSMAGYSVAQWRDASAVQAIGGTVLKGFAERGQSYIYMQYDYTGACGFGTQGFVNVATNLTANRLTGYLIYQA